MRELALKADIVLENYKAGTLERYGLDEASLRKVNPQLIYCSVTGFGQTGPRRDQPAYDFLIQAMGGLMSVTGEKDAKPGGGPQKVGIPIVDLMTGMYTAVAVLAALARRNETGKGDYIDIGMLDVQVATLSNQAMNYLVSGKVPKRNGNAHPNIQPQDVYACADGDVILVVGNDGQFAKLCDVFGRPEWVQRRALCDQRPASAQHRRAVGAAARRVCRMGARAADRRPRRCGSSLRRDQHRRRRVQGPAGQGARDAAGTCRIPVGSTCRRWPARCALPTRSLQTQTAPPLLGQHSDDILSELGYGATDIAALRASGAV